MTAPPLFHLRHGSGRLVVSIPHAGTYIPPDIEATLTAIGRAVIDTDWHVDKLYEFVLDTDASILIATHSRTVVDLNRPPDGGKLYPGQAETGICPSETFAGAPLYATAPPDPAERERRVAAYWQPYHVALQDALARARSRHGHATLLDAHSIRSRIPRLFEGDLPQLNFGTNNGAACTPARADRVLRAAADEEFSQVLNGRFKGGYITRHYGKPADRIDAIQLELAQRTYMDDAAMDDAAAIPPAPAYDAGRAARLVKILHRVVAELSRP
jgi:N-formylglutamate deformylase